MANLMEGLMVRSIASIISILALTNSWTKFVAGEPLGPGGHQQHEGRHQQEEGSWDDAKSEHEDFGQNYEMSNLQSLLGNDSDMGHQTDLKGGHDDDHEPHQEYHHGHEHEDDVDDQRNEVQSHAVIGQGDGLDVKEDFFDYDLL